ncbi:MAG: hypothetical protein ACOC9R_01340 [bacterium]
MNEVEIRCAMNDEQRKNYRWMVAMARPGWKSLFTPLAGYTMLTRLSLVATISARVNSDGGISMAGNPLDRRSEKIDDLATAIGDFPAPVLVVTNFPQVARTARQRLRRDAGELIVEDLAPRPANNSLDIHRRQVDRYQNGEIGALVTALPWVRPFDYLSATRTVVYLDRSWDVVTELVVSLNAAQHAETVVTYKSLDTVEMHQHRGLEELQSAVTDDDRAADFLAGRLFDEGE